VGDWLGAAVCAFANAAGWLIEYATAPAAPMYFSSSLRDRSPFTPGHLPFVDPRRCRQVAFHFAYPKSWFKCGIGNLHAALNICQ
jgi:hypothetical protein